MMTKEALEERVLDSALEDALRDVSAPDLARTIARASRDARVAALARVNEAAANGEPASVSRRWLAAAAAALLGFGVIFGVWTFDRESSDTPRPADASDRVEDPERIVPKSIRQFREFLQQVESVSVRGGYVDLFPTEDRLRVNLDRGMDGFIPLGPADQELVVKTLRRSTRRVVARDGEFETGSRLLLRLRVGRNLHVLVDQARQLIRVFGDGDFAYTGYEFSNRLGAHAAESYDRSQRALGLVLLNSLSTRLDRPGEPFFIPSTVESLEFFGSPPHALTYGIARFESLRSIDVTHSAKTLEPEKMRPEHWTSEARAALADLRRFRGRGLGWSDSTMAEVLSWMPELERLDLSTCEKLGAATLRAIAGMPKLRFVDLSEIELAIPEGAPPIRLGAEARIRLTLHGSELHRAKLERALGGSVEWVDAAK